MPRAPPPPLLGWPSLVLPARRRCRFSPPLPPPPQLLLLPGASPMLVPQPPQRASICGSPFPVSQRIRVTSSCGKAVIAAERRTRCAVFLEN
ncbi:unnamed protein product [Lampetra planeri]